jgi:hypothetical protein
MKVRSLRRLTNKLWAIREARFLSIAERALTMLRESDDPPETEVELNRRLYFCLLTASRELYPDDVISPVMECNNQPMADDESRANREQKRPDFQWVYLDRYEPDPRLSSKQFVMECKRLGNAPRRDWILNVNYSEYGIVRFCDPEWAYAKQAPSGAMLGYWQSMEGKEVLREVNDGCDHRSIPKLVFMGCQGSKGIKRFEQNLVRSFPISPFKLHHLWIDLR